MRHCSQALLCYFLSKIRKPILKFLVNQFLFSNLEAVKIEMSLRKLNDFFLGIWRNAERVGNKLSEGDFLSFSTDHYVQLLANLQLSLCLQLEFFDPQRFSCQASIN